MNTPTNKRISSSSEYETPGDSENSLYFSFTDTPNKENSLIGDSLATSDPRCPVAVSFGLKTKTPLLRKVLQSNFTPRKHVSFMDLPMQSSVTGDGIVKTVQTHEHQLTLNSNGIFDLEPIKETLPNTNIAKSHEVFDEFGIEQDTNSETADVAEEDDEMQNTIIENTSSIGALNKSNKTNDTPDQDAENSQNDNTSVQDNKNSLLVKKVLSEAAAKPQQTRNVTKIDRRRTVKDNRKSILPVAKKPTRATTYKRRSSTYEPRKIDPRKSLGVLKQVANKLSKSVSGMLKI